MVQDLERSAGSEGQRYMPEGKGCSERGDGIACVMSGRYIVRTKR